MIPFARVLNYNNKAQLPPEIKKMQGFSNGIYVLLDNGELYATGANAWGLLMTTSTTQLKKWKLLSADVDYFWVCNYAAVLKMKDGRWMFLGGQLVLGTGDGSIRYSSLLDISPSMNFVQYDPLNPSSTKIQMNIDGMFYLYGTDLYGRGANRFYSLGLGNTTARPSFTRIAENVVDFSVQDLSIGCMYVNTSKAYYYAGSDGGGSWLKNTTFQLFMNSAYNHIGFNGVSDGWQVYSTGDAWAYGANTYKTFGVNGGASPLINPTLLTNSALMLSKNPKVSISCGQFTSWILLDDGLYACGTGAYSGGAFIGTGQIYLPSILPLGVSPSDIIFYGAASGSSLFCTKDTIYYTGLSEALPGVSVSSLVWLELPAIKDNLL